jgi:hypothetical protein
VFKKSYPVGYNIAQSCKSQQHKVSSAYYLPHSDFLFGSIFYLGNGGDMFLRNVRWLSLDYTTLHIPEHTIVHRNR